MLKVNYVLHLYSNNLRQIHWREYNTVIADSILHSRMRFSMILFLLLLDNRAFADKYILCSASINS